jgi:hypothetical protein
MTFNIKSGRYGLQKVMVEVIQRHSPTSCAQEADVGAMRPGQ